MWILARAFRKFSQNLGPIINLTCSPKFIHLDELRAHPAAFRRVVIQLALSAIRRDYAVAFIPLAP